MSNVRPSTYDVQKGTTPFANILPFKKSNDQCVEQRAKRDLDENGKDFFERSDRVIQRKGF